MKICPRRLSARLAVSLLLVLSSNLHAQDVVSSRAGSAYIFTFPGLGVADPKGFVQVGNTITILYWLRIKRGGKSRFISMEASGLKGKALQNMKPTQTSLTSTGEKWVGGFVIRDSGQRQLDITISPKLWSKVQDVPTQKQIRALEETMSRYANLSVRIGRRGTQYRIIAVTID